MDNPIAVPSYMDIQRLEKENKRLRARVESLEEELRRRDIELRDGLLLIIRGVEKRQKIGRYSETAGLMTKEV